MQVYFLDMPVLYVNKYELKYLIEHKIVVKFKNKFVLNKCTEIKYLFSPDIKDFKKLKYLEHINKMRFRCEDCGRRYSFQVRPGIDQNGNINFREIICVCRSCRIKFLKERDILVPQFKKPIDWKAEKKRIKSEIQEKKIINKKLYYRISCKLVKAEKFSKLVLPPLPNTNFNRDKKYKEHYDKLSEILKDDNFTLNNFKYRKIVRNFLYNESSGTCPVCGKKVSINNITIDHIVAKSLGGKNVLENFIGMCKTCNESKDNMTVLEFLCSVELDKMPLRILKEAYAQQEKARKKVKELRKKLKNIK